MTEILKFQTHNPSNNCKRQFCPPSFYSYLGGKVGSLINCNNHPAPERNMSWTVLDTAVGGEVLF